MKILQERKRNAAARFRPVVMRESAVNTYTHNLGVTGLELFLESLKTRNFAGSGGCPIQRIEHQHNVFLPLELLQCEFGSAQMARQFEVRRLFADFNHEDSSSYKQFREFERTLDFLV